MKTASDQRALKLKRAALVRLTYAKRNTEDALEMANALKGVRAVQQKIERIHDSIRKAIEHLNRRENLKAWPPLSAKERAQRVRRLARAMDRGTSKSTRRHRRTERKRSHG